MALGCQMVDFGSQNLQNITKMATKIVPKSMKNQLRNESKINVEKCWEQMSSKRSFGRQNVARRTPTGTQRAPNGTPRGSKKVEFFMFFQSSSPKGIPDPSRASPRHPPREHFVIFLVPKAIPKSDTRNSKRVG